MQYDMTQRLTAVYDRLLKGLPKPGPSGIMLHSFKAGSGYDGEEMAVAHTATGTYAARCQNTVSGAQPTCLRDVSVGRDLSVTYRFSRSLLKDWKAIEILVGQQMAAFLTPVK